jgi:hypothetical protein
MKTKVIMQDFEVNTTPLEKISIDTNSIEILLDDIAENRYKISAKPYQAIRIMTIDCVSSVDYHNDYCFRDGRYHRHILLMENSDFLNVLKEKASEPNFLEKAKHFVLPLQENIIEIIAYDVKVEKAQ